MVPILLMGSTGQTILIFFLFIFHSLLPCREYFHLCLRLPLSLSQIGLVYQTTLAFDVVHAIIV